ncbi:hypothetical protein [Bradyrhizobium mercantei]|uniref:hypothetical protein n=1 Tax=Bradyrhizobium mercantei TaxID=1904807 RepID=UPI0009755F5B|nr:hypothetical protein [Bradyrhizobium mercantei]
MIAVAAVCNVALLALWALLLESKGLPRQGMDALVAALVFLAPASSLLALWRAEARAASSWLLLELEARKVTLRGRMTSEKRTEGPT